MPPMYDEGCEAYSMVCEKLGRLCPRLVPSPLWGLSIAGVARMAPQVAVVVCDGCDSIAESVYSYWMSIDRRGVCEVCGGSGNEVDEDWRYYILVEGKVVCLTEDVKAALGGNLKVEGIAYLAGLRLLCEKCHLAKHLGYAMVTGRFEKAKEHLALVNAMALGEIEKYVETAFTIHSLLSRVSKWTLQVRKVEGLSPQLANSIESLLNKMYQRGFFLYKEWLYYQSKEFRRVLERAVRETRELILEASRKSGDLSSQLVLEELIRVLKARLEQASIRVLEEELKVFLNYVEESYIRSLVREGRSLSRGAALNLVGKWIAFLPPLVYPKAFKLVIERLVETGLAYEGKIIAKRDEYKRGGDKPIIIYVPSALSPGIVAETAQIMKSVLEELGVRRRLYFKPDIFTLKAIYSGAPGFKPYIYVL